MPYFLIGIQRQFFFISTVDEDEAPNPFFFEISNALDSLNE